MIIRPAQRLDSLTAYYFATKLREVADLRAAGHDVINLGVGNPDLPPPPTATAALRAAADRPDAHGYSSYRGEPTLRRALADWYETTYGVSPDPTDEVLPLLGSKEGIFYLSMAFLNPGDRAWVPDPGYPAYAAATCLAGGEAVPYNLRAEDGWLPDVDHLRATLPPRLKVMWLNYPHMPTGAEATPASLAPLVALARERSFLLAHDNPYSTVLTERPLSLWQVPGAAEVSLELNSLSKSHHLAGWRVGVAVGRSAYLDTILKVKSNVDSGMFRAVQEGAVGALAAPGSWHAARDAAYRARQAALKRLLAALGCTPAGGQAGMFVWARLPEGAPDAPTFCDEVLYRAHVFLTPGHVFGRNGTRYLRASLAAPLGRIEEATHRITEKIVVP